jgi:hypothetical protein
MFWGTRSPLTSLSGAALLVITSGRISFALIITLALVWVYVFSLAAAKLGGAYFPVWGKHLTLLFVSSLGSGIFFILLSIFDPALAIENSFSIFLIPVVFLASGLYRTLEYDMLEIVSQAAAEALVLGMLIIGLALIREPLGFGSFSFPGMDIVRFVQKEPLRLLQASSGALVILGYGIAVYRHFRNQYTNSEDD